MLKPVLKAEPEKCNGLQASQASCWLLPRLSLRFSHERLKVDDVDIQLHNIGLLGTRLLRVCGREKCAISLKNSQQLPKTPTEERALGWELAGLGLARTWRSFVVTSFEASGALYGTLDGSFGRCQNASRVA